MMICVHVAGDRPACIDDSVVDRVREIWSEYIVRILGGEFAAGRKSAEVSVAFVTDTDISDLNLKYRGINSATDVLSFPLWEYEGKFCPPHTGHIALGDVVICPGFVCSQWGEDCRCGIVLMLHHGFLHLIGFDHDTEDRKAAMWALQDSMVDAVLGAKSDLNSTKERCFV